MTFYDDDPRQWLRWAVEDLAHAASLVADPSSVWWEVVVQLTAVFATLPPEQYDLDEVVLTVLRRVRSDVLASL